MHDVETCLLILAQDGQAPPLPGETPAQTTTGADGSPNGAATGGGGTGAAPPSGINQFVLIIVVVMVAMILFSVFGQRKEKKRRAAMLSAIGKHDTVQTIGGVVGSVIEVKNDTVVLKVDESSNTRITFARSAIQQVLESKEKPAQTTPIDSGSR